MNHRPQFVLFEKQELARSFYHLRWYLGTFSPCRYIIFISLFVWSFFLFLRGLLLASDCSPNAMKLLNNNRASFFQRMRHAIPTGTLNSWLFPLFSENKIKFLYNNWLENLKSNDLLHILRCENLAVSRGYGSVIVCHADTNMPIFLSINLEVKFVIPKLYMHEEIPYLFLSFVFLRTEF